MRAAAKWALVVLGVLAALLGAGEMIAPRPRPPAERLGLSDVPRGIVVAHPRRGYALRASTEISYGGVQTRLNAQGLRGAWPEAGQPVAVLALGDEVTFGWGVPDGRGYPEQLGAILGRDCPGCGQVVNAGVPGYTTYQGLMLLQQIGPELRPRVVVVAFHLSDALLDGPLTRLTDELHAETDASLDRRLRARSALYGWMRRLGEPVPGRWAETEPRTAINAYRRNLQAVCSEAERAGAEAVVLNVGYAPGLSDGPPRLRRGLLEDDYHASARDVAAAEGARLVEVMSPALGAADMLDAVHPSPDGHARIAAALAEMLSREALLKPAPR